MVSKEFFLSRKYLVIGPLIILSFALVWSVGFTSTSTYDPFYELAQRFLHGRVDFQSIPLGEKDFADFNGKVYWPLGPFPAVLFIPFAIISYEIPDFPIALLFSIAIFIAIYSVSKKIGFSTRSSLWASFGFTFASPLLFVLSKPTTYYLSHYIIVLLLFLSLLEYFGKRRYVLIGVYYAIILATRATAAVTIIFFIADIIIRNRTVFIKMIKPFVKLVVPITISLICLFIYNFIRFDSMFEFGYNIQNIDNDLSVLRSIGLMSIHHIPSNLYYFFIAPPLFYTMSGSSGITFPFIFFSHWGVGLIYTAPYFFSLIWRFVRDRINVLLFGTACITAIPILLYYGIGVSQLGYRYALDFLPFVYVVLLRSMYATYRSISKNFRIVFVLVFVLNMYLIVSNFYLQIMTLYYL